MENLTKNQENSAQNQISAEVLDLESTEKSAQSPDNTRLQGAFETDFPQGGNFEPKNGKNEQNTEPLGRNSAFSELFSCGKAELGAKFPNVSADALYNNKNFELFALGKENQGLCSIYKDFLALCSSIEAEALAKARHQISLEQGAVGALSGAFSPSEPYFTREQVQKMSSEEVRRNFEAIRKSQAHW